MSIQKAKYLGKKIDVLDHGFVRIVDWMGEDLSIVRNARVSYDAAWRTGDDVEKDAKLINYLYTHGHNTPFEAVRFTFDVKAPIFVFRQWQRHRTWSYNEVSARYTAVRPEFYLPSLSNITTQSEDNKQCRTTAQHPQAEYFQESMYQTNSYCHREYENMISMGCPRELARTVLPVSTYSQMFASVDLNNLFKLSLIHI